MVLLLRHMSALRLQHKSSRRILKSLPVRLIHITPCRGNQIDGDKSGDNHKKRTHHHLHNPPPKLDYEKIKKAFDKLTPEQKSAIHRIIRVDHAGELGADRIYAGQLAILGRDPKVGPVIKEMWEQEKGHLKTFENLIPTYRARPTVLHPLWSVAGFALGAGTALLGKEAAMACTIAVETVIGEHYDA